VRIQENLRRLNPLWSACPPVEDVSAFDPVERALGSPLPADYKFFLMWSSGGSTLEPLPHCRLYPLEELLPRRADGQPQGTLEVGTDDSLGFAFDLSRGRHSASYPIVSYPLGDLGREELEDVALTFNGFISSWFQDAELKKREGA